MQELKEYEQSMENIIERLQEDYATIRAGRANPNILNKITVDYYGQPSQIQAVANVSVPEARIIQIQPWDKSMLKEIEKAIQQSDIGLPPANDGTVIRLTLPELTEERRKDLVKDIKKKAENSKVLIRNIRREANELLKKMCNASEISEDEQRASEDNVQKMTDKFVALIDKITEAKSEEILTV